MQLAKRRRWTLARILAGTLGGAVVGGPIGMSTGAAPRTTAISHEPYAAGGRGGARSQSGPKGGRGLGHHTRAPRANGPCQTRFQR